MSERRMLYADHRPYVVSETLEELTGPTSGVVALPLHLDWSEQGRYNLAEPRELNVMYERVLREADSVDDLRTYLNGEALRRVWPRLFLPIQVRRLWEGRFASLSRAA